MPNVFPRPTCKYKRGVPVSCLIDIMHSVEGSRCTHPTQIVVVSTTTMPDTVLYSHSTSCAVYIPRPGFFCFFFLFFHSFAGVVLIIVVVLNDSELNKSHVRSVIHRYVFWRRIHNNYNSSDNERTRTLFYVLGSSATSIVTTTILLLSLHLRLLLLMLLLFI